ncbi:CHAP domain-containing protein [Nocardioides coralli]|uniref:CHAP domain-containing protein n=1 Tax=Nocardioides coralli TaxID=2872154 RepID=UPI001CA3D30C|nr:CHAP domain-containing protein [Nocardioides coralli]QZY30394.1 CHAP domain-containing protein [Nocardioides coralli]
MGERVRAWRVLLASVVVVATMMTAAGPLSAAPGGSKGHGASAKPVAGGGKKDKEPVWTGTPGTNLAHDTFGYPWPAAPDCYEGDVSSSGCVNDGRGYFQGQCTSWVAFRLAQRNGVHFHNYFDGAHWGNARDWAKAAKKTGYLRNKVPASGSIGWYARGHVSYVEEVNSDGSIVISEMNTDGHNGFHVVTVYPGGAGWPDKFIHVADVVPVDVTAPQRPRPVAASHVDRGVTLRWKASADDVGVAGYRVLRNGVPLAETTEPAYVDRTASAGQNYRYTVRAHDAAGNVSKPAAAGVSQDRPVRPGPFLRATEVDTGSGPVLCGRLAASRGQQVGCRVRTLDGWRVVRTGRPVERGVLGTRAFVGDGEATIWFCRQFRGNRDACTAFDLATLSWGFDQVSRPRATPPSAVWVASSTGPARCAVVNGKAGCQVLTERGWAKQRRTLHATAGDVHSRAFLATGRGVAFCRVAAGRPTCTVLDEDRLTWGRGVSNGRGVGHGRWGVRKNGPVLCAVGEECRLVVRR